MSYSALATFAAMTAKTAAGDAVHAHARVRAAATAAPGASFGTPSTAFAPKFRWWWPNGEIDVDEIIREVGQVADAGFGGLEIADVHHSVDSSLLDVVHHGWGSKSWIAAVEAALEEGSRRNVSIDITLGPSWPAAIPSITPQSDAALTELAHGSIEVAPGDDFDGAVPAAIAKPASGVTEQSLLALHVAQIVEKPSRGPMVIDRESLVDITDQVTEGNVSWTAPDGDRSWMLIAYWQRGSGQQPEGGAHTDPTSYVVDHFSSVGAQALIDYWEEKVLTARIKELLPISGGAFFEDSLEIETDATIWTRNIRDEFEERHGYKLEPWLPILIEHDEKYVFDFANVKNNRVRDDYNHVLSDLYTENHLIMLRDWAHGLGVEYRVQAYGLEQDSIQQAGIVDIPETESLGAKNVDDYRVLASGRDLAGHTILSCEAAAYFGAAYNSTWNRVLQTLGETFVGGVNQTVLHGFPYLTAPGAQWPGFAAFSPYYDDAIGYSEAWGPRTPNWTHVQDISAFIARTQWILQQGRAHYDIAFLRQKGWAQTGIGAPWATRDGIPVGWTHGFLSESSVDHENAVVKNKIFAPGGGDYKAIVVDIDRFRGREATLSVTVAKKLVSFAKSGLPIVLYGDWSSPESTGFHDADTNHEVAGLVVDLKAFSNVAMAPDDPDILTALTALGVGRSVSYEFSNLKHIHRVDGERDYYYFANARHNPPKDKLELIDEVVTLRTTSVDSLPFALDAWTGEITPLADFARDGRDLRLRIRLTPGQSIVIVLADDEWTGVEFPRTHVVETNADRVSTRGEKIYLESATSGTMRAKLSTGSTKEVEISALPQAVSVTSWKLAMDSWEPKNVDGTETTHVRSDHTLSELAPWSQIGGLADVSGVGTYSAVFELNDSWAIGLGGAYLSLGAVSDTFRVWINSQLVKGTDIFADRIDISNYVRSGRNNLRVEVTSTLLNRLRVVNPTVYGVAKRAEYGLMGPVTVSAFGRVRVA